MLKHWKICPKGRWDGTLQFITCVFVKKEREEEFHEIVDICKIDDIKGGRVAAKTTFENTCS